MGPVLKTVELEIALRVRLSPLPPLKETHEFLYLKIAGVHSCSGQAA